MEKFILNDETKTNSYGFRILNSGIDLTRFLSNPVMLDNHENTIGGVIGRWKNIAVANGKLTADAEFDKADEAAKGISESG